MRFKAEIVWVVSFLLLAPAALGQSAADRKLELLRAYPDLIVVNGKIATMDARMTQVQAMAVRNNRILALGTNDEIRFLAGPKTEVLDAKGRVVLPGLVDSHTHPHVWAVEHWLGEADGGNFAVKKYNEPQLKFVHTNGNDQAEVLRSLERVVRERANELGPGKWILVTMYAKDNIVVSRKIVAPLFPRPGSTGGILTPEYLDTIAPNNPLSVHNSEIIGGQAHNTRAKEEMIKWLGEEVSSHTARVRIPFDIILRGRTDAVADILKQEMLTCLLPQGVTSFGNRLFFIPSILKAFNLLYQRGEMPARFAWYHDSMGGGGGISSDYPIEKVRFFYQNLGDSRGLGNDYLWNAGVANEAWESGIGCTIAKPLDPNNPKDRMRDCAVPTDYDKQQGYAAVKVALENGLRIGFMHGYSDGTYEAMFHMIEEQISKGNLTLEQVRAMRIGFDHDPIIRPDQIEKIAKYNMRLGFNGYQIQGDLKAGAFLKAYGEKYMTWIIPMNSLAQAGAHPVFNTDAHLFKDTPESKPMDWPPQWDGNIWAFIEFFITRRMPHETITYNRAEAVDRETLMKAATIWSAEIELNEKNIGSLEVGKLADFIVIDKDYFTIPEDQVHTINTLLTAVGGKVLYKSSNY